MGKAPIMRRALTTSADNYGKGAVIAGTHYKVEGIGAGEDTEAVAHAGRLARQLNPAQELRRDILAELARCAWPTNKLKLRTWPLKDEQGQLTGKHGVDCLLGPFTIQSPTSLLNLLRTFPDRCGQKFVLEKIRGQFVAARKQAEMEQGPVPDIAEPPAAEEAP